MKSADGIFLALWFKLGGVKGFAVSMAAMRRAKQAVGQMLGIVAKLTDLLNCRHGG